jgi:hypothetical protein
MLLSTLVSKPTSVGVARASSLWSANSSGASVGPAGVAEAGRSGGALTARSMCGGQADIPTPQVVPGANSWESSRTVPTGCGRWTSSGRTTYPAAGGNGEPGHRDRGIRSAPGPDAADGDYAVTACLLSLLVTWMLRGLAASRTGMVSVSTPAA